MALIVGSYGASTDKSVMFNPERQFTDLEELLEIIREHRAEMLAG